MCGYTFAYKALHFRSKKWGNSKMFAVNIFLFILKTLIFLSPRAHAATGRCFSYLW